MSWYDRATTFDDATPVHVRIGDTTPGITYRVWMDSTRYGLAEGVLREVPTALARRRR